jgi:hypothetical protein
MALLPALAVALASVASAENGYRLLDNTHFNTVANGPLGGVVVDVTDPASRAEGLGPLQHRGVRPAGPRRGPGWFEMLKRRGLLPKRLPAPAFPRTVFKRCGGRLVTPNLDRQRQTGDSTLGDATNTLTYTYTPDSTDTSAVAWSTTQQTALSTFLATAQAEIVRDWGGPAFNNTVNIVHDPSLTSLDMAVYDASTKEIRLELLNDAGAANTTTSTVDDWDLYTLTLAVLMAYRDEAAPAYDSWQEGMARAAQAIIITNVLPDFGMLARDVNLLYGSYDLLNQPGLESPSFMGGTAASDANDLVSSLSTIRAYLCQAAWLKALAQTSYLFAQFNAAYYQALASDSTVAESIPALRNLMASLAPTVEGLGFDEWYVRQYCFDTSVVPGARLYVFYVAEKDFVADEPTNAMPMYIYEWLTDAGNGTTPLSGTANITYAAYDGFDLTAAVQGASGDGGITTALGQNGNSPGVGTAVALFFNIAGDQDVQQQRIIATVTLNGVQRALYYPNDVILNDDSTPNELYGLVTNGFQGTLGIAITGFSTVTADVIQGAFKCVLPSDLPAPATATITWTPDSSGGTQTATIYRNVMFLGPLGSGTDVATGQMCLVLDTPPATWTTFSTSLAAGTSMISVPAIVGQNSSDKILGVAANQLLLARADGAVPSFEPWRQGSIYRIWPATPPFQPGYGYWLTAPSALNVSFQGVPADTTNPYPLTLPPGWQQFGLPWTSLAIKLSDLTLQGIDGSSSMSLAAAQTAGLVSSGVFGYNGTGYSLVATDTDLNAWQGYWINVLAPRGLTLTFPNSASSRRHTRSLSTKTKAATTTAGTTSAATTPSRPARRLAGTANSWRLGLTAQYGALTDRTAVLGVEAGVGSGYNWRDVPQPPPYGPYVAISFPHNDWGAYSARYTQDLRAPLTATGTWDFSVDAQTGGQTVTLSWPDVSGVPADIALTLTDLANGRQIWMRNTAAYSFTLGSGASRALRVTAQPHFGGGLTVSGLAARASRGSGGAVSFNLNAAAIVTANLISLGGRVVRVLATDRAAAAGLNSLTFVAADEQGRALPNGVYRLELVAMAADGQQVRAASLVNVER